MLNWKDWRPELSEQPPLEELLKSLPDKIIKHYTIADTIIYRGMVIQDDKVYESTICSWTTDLNKAKEFANNEDYYDLVSSNLVGKVDQENRVNKVVYVKKGEGLDLDKLVNFRLP